jgi:hypothetical protein
MPQSRFVFATLPIVGLFQKIDVLQQHNIAALT